MRERGSNLLQSVDEVVRDRSRMDDPPRHDLVCIDVATMRGLEIGALAAPRVTKDQGRVFYVDHAGTEGIRKKYENDPDMKNRLDEIVEVDYVVDEGQGIYQAVAHDAPFDYVIASHVIEHIPDPVSWLADIATTLRTGGILSLVVPDKRYCFDINRRTTDISEVVDAYLRRLRRPSFKQVYDFISKEISGKVDTAAVWAGTVDYRQVVRSDVEDPDVAAWNLCREVERSDAFVDVHCSVFTPDSFLELFERLARLGLLEFEIAYFAPTEVNTLEFNASLRRMDPQLERKSMIERQLASIRRARLSTKAGPGQPDRSNHAENTMAISPMEYKLIATKRRILGHLREATRRRLVMVR
jgi:SAM-dependent methyltransferase